MMIDAADLFEIGKYIDSPLKQKFFPNRGDMGQKLLGAEVKLMWMKEGKGTWENILCFTTICKYLDGYTLTDTLPLWILPSQRREGQFLCIPPEQKTGSTPSSSSYADAACLTGCLLALQWGAWHFLTAQL